MRRRMTFLFKMGVTVIVLISVLLFYYVHDDHASAKKTEKNWSKHSSDDVEQLVDSTLKTEKDWSKHSADDVEQLVGSNLNKKNHAQESKENLHFEEKSDNNKLPNENPVIKAGLEKMAKIIDQEETAELQKLGNKKGDQVKGHADNFKVNLNPVKPSVFQDGYVHLSVVACGNRFEETMVMLKSAALQAIKPLYFHIFADEDLRSQFQAQLSRWPEPFKSRVKFDIHPVAFPKVKNGEEWKTLFKPCAALRLFLPIILHQVDALLYVDTDVLFMRPIDDVWSHFEKFNASHIAALAPEHEDAAAGWYNRFARHPYYGRLGVNSGVMLMNLTKLRDMDFASTMIEYYKIYKYNITWGDQDLINVLFHNYPEKLYVYECDWNYRPDHCMYMSVCKAAERNGVSVLHGCRQSFHNEKQPTFKAVYNAFDKFQMGANLKELLDMAKILVKETAATQCGKVGHLFTDQLEKQIIGKQRH